MYILGRQGSPEPNAAPLHTGSARVLFAFAIIFPLLTALMIWARFHSRLIRRANLWLDDWLVVFTLLMHIGQAIAIMTGMINIYNSIYLGPAFMLTNKLFSLGVLVATFRMILPRQTWYTTKSLLFGHNTRTLSLWLLCELLYASSFYDSSLSAG